MSKYNKVSPLKVIMIILAVLLVVAAAALAVYIYSDGMRQGNMNANVDNSFLFGTCYGDVNDVELNEELISVKAMQTYNGEVKRITSAYFLDQLREAEEDKAVSLYNALIYAYNNNYNFISVPASLYDDTVMLKAVYYANCDLPIMDLNTQVGYSDSSITMADGTVSKRYYVYLPTGGKNHLNFKRQAVEEAKKIAATLPESCQTDMQKAAYFHDWLVQNVRYTADVSYVDSNPYYLYDALVGRVTNSDGFSRTYTLLLNLCGVESFTVFRAEGGGQIAHAWNIFKADGQYYQADATHDANVYSLGLGNLKLHFCLSASAMGNGNYHQIISGAVPACMSTNHDYDHVDLVVQGTDASLKNNESIIALRQKLDNGAEYVTLRCPAFDPTDWEKNFKVITRWFAESKVSFKVSNAGNYSCVLYPGK